MNKLAKYSAAVTLAIAAIVQSVIVVEGDYVDHPSDPGGKTMFGITEQVARQHGYKGDMRDLSKETAKVIYEETYIYKPGFDQVVAVSTVIGHKSIDAGVNVGPPKSAVWLQTALNSLNRKGKDYADIKVDGVVGPSTMAAYTSLQRVRGRAEACKLVLKLIDAQQAAYYLSLNNLREFTVGWVSHRIGNIPLENCNNDVPK